MRNLRGAYMGFAHDRKEDWDWLREWQPSVIRLMLHGSHTDPGSVSVPLIERVHQTCPEALILLRVWDVDDRGYEAHEAMKANPLAEAEKQVEWWARLFDRIRSVPRQQLMAGLNNEPMPNTGASLFPYTERALMRAVQVQIRLGAWVFSVGNPALPGEGPFDMAYYSRLEQLFLAGDHARLLHEYMQPEGMYAEWYDEAGQKRVDYGHLIGRHKQWPLKRVKTIIGEWGIDGLLYNRHLHPEFGNSGWRNFPELWPPERYANEYVECVRQADDNVLAICPFISDFADRKWASFDVLPAYQALLERKHLCVKVDLPDLPVAPLPPEPQTTFLPAMSKESRVNWERVYPIVLDIEGGYSTDARDKGNWTGGAVGVGVLKGTKFGISAGAYPHLDIANLTKEQALELYKRDYWQASGADTLPWPMCLVHFDTYVQNNVVAPRFLAKAAGNPVEYLALRLDWYNDINDWSVWGGGWAQRVVTLLHIVAETVGS